MRQRRDEAQPPVGLGHGRVAGRPAGAVVAVGQGPMLGQPGAHQRQRQILVGAVAVDVAQRHGLDQGQVVAPLAAPADHVGNLVLVDALQRHRVDLDRQPRIGGGAQAVQHLGQAAPAGDARELGRVQRVQRHIHPAHPGGMKLGGEAGQLAAVGGQGQLVQRAGVQMPAQALEQPHHVAAHQRLAAGDPELAHAARDERAAQPVQFLQGQQVGLGQKGHVFRHAIHTAEIAPVGDRDAQIADVATERVDHRAGLDRGCGQIGHNGDTGLASRLYVRRRTRHVKSPQADELPPIGDKGAFHLSGHL